MINAKSAKQIKIMAEGGKKLAKIKEDLKKAVKVGVSAYDIEKLADKLIKKAGGQASFKMVPKYRWATCINVNAGVVHGIPHKSIRFKRGDVVSVDVGIFYKGFHTDTSFTFAIEPDSRTKHFLAVGKNALKNAINEATIGNRIYDISKAIQDTLESNKLTPIKALVGHGIGRQLHEEPYIPCFVGGARKETPKIVKGTVLAIEVMYTMGLSDVILGQDQWTIVTEDGKIAALFEETVAVTDDGPKVLTN